MFDKKIMLPHQYYYPAMRLVEDRVTPERRTEFVNSLSVGGRKGLLYVHFPFCDSHCAFCGFDKHYQLDDIDRYVEKLKEELAFYAQFGFQIQNIHFGGGTPTLVPGKSLSGLVRFIRENYDCLPDMQINIEGSATSIYREDILRFIKDSGISRASVGIQTFSPEMRDIFQTKATLQQVHHTLSVLRENQIPVFVDILFGYPDFRVGKSPEEIVRSDIQTAMDYDVAGIDFSQIYPYGNKLSEIIARRNLTFPSARRLTDLADTCINDMEAGGYHQQSSYGFVRQGKIIMESSYYGGADSVADTLGVGCSAFGILGNYKYRNSMYSGYMRGSVPSLMQVKKLTHSQMQQIDIVGFPKLLVLSKKLLHASEYSCQFEEKLQQLKREGYVEELPDEYRLTRKGTLFVDNIYLFMLDDEEREIVQQQMKTVVYD